MKAPIDQIKEAIEYLENKKMDRNSIPVFRWLLKEEVSPISTTSYPPSITMPRNELVFEYNYRHRIWELKL